MIQIEDIAYARIAGPDLDLMETFFVDFGMQRSARSADVLHLRGHGTDPVCLIVHRDAARQIGFGLRAQSRADLEALASQLKTRIEPRLEPGGGEVVWLQDPDGNRLEIVHGVEPRTPERLRAPVCINSISQRVRLNEPVRLSGTPAHIMRLGHVALHARDFNAMYSFYRDLLGFKLSDSYFANEPGKLMGAFLHCDLGERFTDHHTVAVVGSGRTGFDHLGFEVLDWDDLILGHRHLRERGRWEHCWGIGRHVEGSQIFDYWRDPSGVKVEHWTDGDLVNETYRGHSVEFSIPKADSVLAQWGPPFNPDFLR
jgi:catechol 2,3-dioxygenase-like lactoylglutathione lyase family enzyme